MRKVILLTAMPKESVWSSSIYVNGGGLLSSKISFSRILLLFVCCIFCNNVFAQDEGNWQTIQNFERLTNSDVKACTTDGNTTTNATVSIDTAAGHGKIGKLYKSGKNTATYGIVFSVSLGTNKLKNYKNLRIDTYATNGYKVLGIYVRRTSTSGQFQQIASLGNGFDANNTWKTQTLDITTDYEYSDVDFFIAAVEAYDTLTIQIDNIELFGPAIASSPVKIDIDETENNTITAQYCDTVRLKRTLTAGMWNTICLPFVPSSDQVNEIFGVGAKFAEFTSVSNGVMQFTSVVGSLEAGKPYLVLPTENRSTDDKVELTGVTIPATAINPKTVKHRDSTGDYEFIGTYVKKSFANTEWETTRFVGTDNNLLKPNSDGALRSLRAYFTVPVPGGSGASGGGAKNYTYAVDSFVPTSIANIQIEGDGDGAIYNIGGQRVEGKSLPKGIYIRDGKKFVVK